MPHFDEFMRMMHDPFPVLKTMDSVDPQTGILAEDTNCFRTDMASEAAGTILQESLVSIMFLLVDHITAY